MIRRQLIAVGLSILLVAAPSAQVAAPQVPATIPPELALTRTLPIDPAVKTGRLPNGLRYFIRQNARPAKRVAMRLAVNAGAIQEQPDQRGLAHFLEHMAFNGTENFKPGELVSFLESIGARFGPHVNASTSFDETIYMLEMPTDRAGYVDRGMLVLRDFAAGISLLPAEVEKERGVVLEEWRGRLGAGSRLTDKQLPVIFQGSRYAERLPIGLPEVLKSAPRERLLAFYQAWYRPDNMAVVVVGDIPVAEAEALIQKHFGGIAAAKGAAASVDTSVPISSRSSGITVSRTSVSAASTRAAMRGVSQSIPVGSSCSVPNRVISVSASRTTQIAGSAATGVAASSRATAAIFIAAI